jgi:hypothetical protein
MNVFIGGSRAFSKLNPVIRGRLDDLIRRGCTILIGDANGADRAVQSYFAKQHYTKVVVYCMEQCRNNVGDWPIRKIDPPNQRRDFSYYSAKDAVMSEAAQCGLMLWDAKSKGTLKNMLNLVGAGKRTLVYFAPTKEFHVLTSEQDLRSLLDLCNKDDIEAASRALRLKTSVAQSRFTLPIQ